jgi:nucleotide-binding universal stress UspA family protein
LSQGEEGRVKPMIPQIKRISFTTDLSKKTRHAFKHAGSLAIQYGAIITILYVMDIGH